jgi:S-sulfosulfanyl-L-cysteine sulfohydrolase
LRERERVNLVVVLSHLGFPQDAKLASEVEGIDLLLSGHTHNRMDEPLVVNGATIIQSGCHGSFVGRLDVEFDGGQVGAIHHQLIHVSDSIPADPDMDRLIGAIVSPHRKLLSEVVGQTVTALNRNTFLESTMDNLLLQAVAEAADARIAFCNGWRYGAPITPGPVTVNDLWNIVPPNPPVSTVELTGQEMWDMIEENLEHTLAANPYQQMGGYVKRCLGLTLYVKFENPAGSRIQQCFIGDEDLKRDEVYTAAFVTTQGVPEQYGRNRRDLELHAIDALMQYCAAHLCVNADLRGTVIAV